MCPHTARPARRNPRHSCGSTGGRGSRVWIHHHHVHTHEDAVRAEAGRALGTLTPTRGKSLKGPREKPWLTSLGRRVAWPGAAPEWDRWRKSGTKEKVKPRG